MPSFDSDSSRYVAEGGVLVLDGAALRELMGAALTRGAPFRFSARGTSMEPFVHDGDVLTVVPGVRQAPGLGRVIAYLAPDPERIVVHRVVATRPAGVVARGDGAGLADGIVRPSQVMGVVVRAERGGRTLRLGLGAERRLIALLSRWGLLVPAVDWARRWRRRWRGGRPAGR
ncbi:MAG: S26 family signal peptidase [Thermoleophilia bacterium]